MSMSGEHTIALMGVLFLPVALIPVLYALQTFAARSERVAAMWWRIASAGTATRIGSLLLLASADIHLTLVPGHLVDAPITGVLFLVDGIALTAAAIAVFMNPCWRVPCLALLAANVVVYALYLVAGWEGADVIGVGTKLIEVGGIVAILDSSRVASMATLPTVYRALREGRL
jgi:hypothetical protein